MFLLPGRLRQGPHVPVPQQAWDAAPPGPGQPAWTPSCGCYGAAGAGDGNGARMNSTLVRVGWQHFRQTLRRKMVGWLGL